MTDTVFKFTEVFELAARIATGGEIAHLNVEVEVTGLAGRHLVVDNPNRTGFTFPRIARIPAFPQTFSLKRDELLAQAPALAVKAAAELFSRFQWDPGIEFLTTMQNELFRR